MEETLRDICAVVGVSGCFVCDDAGRVRASAPLEDFDERVLETVGRTISQTTAGLFMSRRRKVHEIDLLYSKGRVVIKPLAEGFLCVICARTMNVPLLNLTANVAARKLTEAMRSGWSEPEAAAPEGVAVDHMLEEIADAYPDLVGPILDLDQTLTSETREAVLTALGKGAGATVFRSRYANMRVPSSISQGLQLVVVPAVSPFAIANAQGNRLDVLACPFCRRLRSPSPHCQFLAGFVQGLLNSIPGLEGVGVGETLCRAKGDDTCTFVAEAESRRD
jgi:predicted regulator of Ras-like GTPase activity (Roadblock/LC7/MglB family)